MANLVGIDASRYTVTERTGTENYSFHLLSALAAADHDDLRLRFYLNAPDATVHGTLAGGDLKAIPFPRFWTHGRLSVEMAVRRPDLLFVPSHVIPLIHPRSVVTIHDLGYLHEPAAHPARQRWMLDRATRWNAKVAARVIAISTATKSDLLRHYGVAEGKVTVVSHGVAETYRPPTPDEIAAIRARLGLPEHFVLAVGTLQPRKNLGNLARAVRLLREDGQLIALVTAGKRGWMADEVEQDIRVALPDGGWLHLGFVPERDLPSLYGASSAVAMVSRYEGFGLPVLEAMACGAPVVISDRGSLPEVAGGCALIANPDVPNLIAVQLRRLYDDPVLRTRLVSEGMVRASTFTWDRAARETLGVLREVLHTH